MPLIGVTACRKIEDYRQAILHVGGDVQIVDASMAPGEVIDRIDGLLLTGGEDLAPARYGEAPHPSVVDVDPAGHLTMPAHIHPGTCADLVPQPLYPLESVTDGDSETVVPRSLSELLAGDLALNLHVSFEEMGTYAACVELN